MRAFRRRVRWPSNLGVAVLNAFLVRLVVPAGSVGVAFEAEKRGWGLMNGLAVPHVFAFAVGLLLLDLAIYLQHVMFHAVPALWRVHRMHHADLDFDVTTGSRFHPVEILLSLGFKLATVAALGPLATAVLVFEAVLNATSMFNHSNLRIPESVDGWLRILLVTPDMHRVHHFDRRRRNEQQLRIQSIFRLAGETRIASARDRFSGRQAKVAAVEPAHG